jgi:beta-lactamase regulating signal transducer with metallopeptidase domain
LRLDTAGRSFGVLALASLVGFVLTGMGTCVLLSVAAYRVASDGAAAVTEDIAVLPAALFVVATTIGVILAAASLRRQARGSRALARRVRALDLPPPARLASAAARVSLSGRVVLVDDDQPFSFVFGAFRPRVAVSRGLLEAATDPELDAVLEHERYHVRYLDPLRVLIARALPRALFYAPVLGQLRERYVAGRELAADRRAADRHGRGPLAGALFKVLRGPDWPELSAAAAIGGPELMDVRVEQLETGREPAIRRVARATVAVSILSSLLLAVAFGAAVGGLGWPDAQKVADIPLAGLFMAAACAAPWLLAGLLAWMWLSGPRDPRDDEPRRERGGSPTGSAPSAGT